VFSIPYAICFFLVATALALLEIQIEGPYGWAEKAPCWRPAPDSFIARTHSKVMGGKPLTGYHIAIFGLVFLIVHIPFFSGVSWSPIKELEVFSLFFLLSSCWDFLWFVWNPFYGLKKFRPEFIWWHKNWLRIGSILIPFDYPKGIAISLFFSLIAAVLGEIGILAWWGITLGIFGGLTLISCLVALLIKREGQR